MIATTRPRCDWKDHSLERHQPHGLRYARTRRCAAKATVEFRTRPGYYPTEGRATYCEHHALAADTNSGWERVEAAR